MELSPLLPVDGMPFHATWAHICRKKGWLCEAIIHMYSYIFSAQSQGYIPVHSSVVCYLSYYLSSSALPQTNITKETHLYWDIIHVWRCYLYMVREFAHECVMLVLRMASIPSFLVNFLTLFILIATITQGWFFTVEYFHQTNILEMINAFVIIYFEDCGKICNY